MEKRCEACKNTRWRDSNEVCPKCGGSCYDPLTRRPCDKCKGIGKVPVRVPCPICNPKGELPDKGFIIR